MTEKAFLFLDEHKEGVLATVANSRPQTRVFQVMRIEGTALFFATAPQKEVCRQLRENPNIEFIVLHDKVSVRCSGKALFDVDEATCRWIYGNNPVLPRLYTSWEKLVYFRVPVERMEYFDLRSTPPIAEHYNLADGSMRDGFRGERFSRK